MTRLYDARPFVIAEVGSNFKGLDEAKTSVRAAKECGADAVKFQSFNGRALYGFDGAEAHGVPDSYLPALKRTADEVGIELMSTAFSPELVAVVDPYVTVHKVASSDMCWPQLLQTLAATGKPVLVSTGAKTEEEIDQARQFLPRALFLYCVAAYPADFVDFTTMGKFYGFSDHTLGITAAVEAAIQGTRVIEKHFTAFPGLDTPDRPHSIGPHEFKRMVKAIRGFDTGKIGPTAEEGPMLLRHNRRLVATRDIAQGEAFVYGSNYGAFRSLRGENERISPFAWQTVEGRLSKNPIARGDGIKLGDFG